MITMYDAVEVTKPHMTKDGYLVAEARVARSGIQNYLAKELGMDGDPDRVVRVYRPPEEVFSQDAMASYAFKPVTVLHPGEMVDAVNWREYARGQTGGEILRDGECVRIPLVLMDGGAIDEWRKGKKELSMGYTMDLEVVDGETPEGEKYEAVQRNQRMNHLALVPRARGGSQLRLGDNQPEGSRMSDKALTTITVDGLSVQTTDAGAMAISKLQGELSDSREALEQAESNHAAEIATKDRELAAKDAEIDEMKGKVLDESALDARVLARADLIARAKTVADKDYTGLSDEQIRKTAVSAKAGTAAVDGKSADYIEARFDHLAEIAGQDPVRRTLRDGVQPTTDGADKAHAAMVADKENAWKHAGGVA